MTLRHTFLIAAFAACTILLTSSRPAIQVKSLEKSTQAPVQTAILDDGAIIADFGKAAFAQLTLTVNTPNEANITVHLGEAASEGRVNRQPGATIRYTCYELHVSPEKESYPLELRKDPRNTRHDPESGKMQPILMPEETGEVYPFRYVEVEGLPQDAACSLERTAVNYPFNDDASYFHCSDTVLNAVWDLCKYSIKATSFCGYYVDGDRERIPYEADALINQLSHYGVDSEYGMARQTAEYLFTHPTWPTEWQLDCVLIAWYDYLYTGDKTLIEKYYDLLKAKTLIALKEDNGLISTLTGKVTPEFLASINFTISRSISDIVDWPRSGSFGLEKKEAGEADGYILGTYNTVVNAFHYETLVLMGRIAKALGRKADAKDFAQLAQASCEAVNSLLFDADAKCYRDGLNADGSPIEHHSLHGNMLPLLFGMVPQEQKAQVLEFIRSRSMACSVYGAQFLMEALYDAFDSDYALSLLASTSMRSWYNMIRFGTTITAEAWDPCVKNNLDWNHAWGAAPANIIPRKLVGVEPLEPGFRRMRIRPQMGGLSEFTALVPTIRGGVSVAARKVAGESLTLDLSIPARTRTEVWMQLPSSETATLTVDGRRRRFKSIDGFAVLRVRGGKHKCVIISA